MGMSASQARLIALTSRMSDIEYQGQQINQQRTTLSNQVNELYNTLLDMDVPTPPSTSDFTKVVYTGKDGAATFTLGTVTPTGANDDDEQTYSVTLKTTQTGHSMEKASYDSVVKTKEGGTGYAVGDNDLYKMTDVKKNQMSEDSWLDYIEAIRHSIEIPNMDMENASNEDIANAFYVYFTVEDGRSIPHFILQADIVNAQGATTSAKTYEYDPDGTYEYKITKNDCRLEFDPKTGRILRIGYPDPTDGSKIVWRDVEATTTTDQAAYQDAFNEYEYQKFQYDKKQQEINVKTSIIQAEDKNLELKLTRLDNERNAVKTEIEAVKKVVDENIDKSFKTFSG